MENIKILLIMSSPIDKNSAMGKTIESLFRNFNKEDLCSVYFNIGEPDFQFCSSYYQIHDRQLLKSCFGLIKKNCGGEVKESQKITQNNSHRNNLTRHKNNICIRILRECLWNISGWKNKNFLNWLEKQKIDVIFTIMHDMNASLRNVDWISQKLNCPTILFVTDDYYNDFLCNKNPIRKLYYKKRTKDSQQLAKHIQALIGCSDKATNYFAKEFNIKFYKTLYTPSNMICLNMPLKEESHGIIKIRYFGNIRLQRWKVLRDLGKSLSIINKDCQKAILEIYSNETNDHIISQLNIENGSIFKGFVSGNEYLNLLQDTDIAVHVESFDENMIRRTWCSISTKISDYLGAGKCILAIGPKEISSIDHLKNVSYVINNPSQLVFGVNELIDNNELRKELSIRSRELAIKEHNIDVINQKLHKIFKYVLTENE